QNDFCACDADWMAGLARGDGRATVKKPSGAASPERALMGVSRAGAQGQRTGGALPMWRDSGHGSPEATGAFSMKANISRCLTVTVATAFLVGPVNAEKRGKDSEAPEI